MKTLPLITLSAILLAGCTSTNTKNTLELTDSKISVITPTETINNQTPTPMAKNITAILHTTEGDITIALYPDKAPVTVSNFIDLSKGTREWINPKDGKKMTNTPLYNGTIFHRVIAGFMIQGGDPAGSGMGGPGYRFKDEFDPSLTFSEPYLLAMANAGPGTNGSQFFITVEKTPHLNNRHTIFGKVVKGTEVVDKIANTKTDMSDKPLKDVVISSVDIIEEK